MGKDRYLDSGDVGISRNRWSLGWQEEEGVLLKSRVSWLFQVNSLYSDPSLLCFCACFPLLATMWPKMLSLTPPGSFLPFFCSASAVRGTGGCSVGPENTSVQTARCPALLSARHRPSFFCPSRGSQGAGPLSLRLLFEPIHPLHGSLPPFSGTPPPRTPFSLWAPDPSTPPISTPDWCLPFPGRPQAWMSSFQIPFWWESFSLSSPSPLSWATANFS